MNKFVRFSKRLLALFIVAILNINTYATTTSNDGSAFITKAEFDTLIKNFNDQFNNYQSGLNAKIDQAISSYIGGLATTTTGTLVCDINSYTRKDRTWWNNSESDGTPLTGNDIRLRAATFAVMMQSWFSTNQTGSGTGAYAGQGYSRINSYAKDNGAPNYTIETRDANGNMNKVKYKTVEKNGTQYLAVVDNQVVEPVVSILRYGATVMRQATANVGFTLPTNTTWTTEMTASNEKKPGIYIKSSLGLYEPNYTSTNAYTTTYFNSIDRKQLMQQLPGADLNADCKDKVYYGIVWDKRYNFDSTTTKTKDIKETTGGARAVSWATGGSNMNQRETDVFRYVTYTQRIYGKKLTEIVNESATKYYDEPVYIHNGIPLFTNDKAGTIKFKLNLIEDTGSSFKNYVAIKNKKWGTAGPEVGKASDDVYYNDDASGELDITIKQSNSNKTTYWLKVCPITVKTGTAFNNVKVEVVGDVNIEYE